MGNSESRSTPTNKPPTPPEVKQSDISWMDGWRADVKFLEAASKKGHELGKTPVVLVGSGAFCPVHRGHLLMMRAAAKALPDKRHVVVGAILIPAPDAYIDAKMSFCKAASHFQIPFEMRSKLIRATANDLKFSDSTGGFPVHISDAEQTDRLVIASLVLNSF